MSTTTPQQRVLIVAPYFPPRARVGAQRPLKFVRHLAAHGFAPAVVCLNSREAGDDGALPAGLPQLRLHPWFEPRSAPTQRALRPVERASLRARVDAHIPIDSWWPVLMLQLPRVLRFARAFAPHVIWSTADPWSSHALGLRVARALRLPWVADFRDPWTLCQVRGRERPAWVRAIDARTERRYLHAASALTFTAARTTQRYAAAYPALAGRMFTLENSFDERLFDDDSTAPQSAYAVTPGAALTLTFFGRFRALSSAARISQLLARLRQLHPDAAEVRVRCVGGLDAFDRARAEALGIADAFESIPSLPLAQGLRMLRQSDLVLLSSEPGRDEIIPAKLFDYLAAGRPILALADNPDSRAILESTGLGQQFSTEQLDAAAQALAACVRAKRGNQPLPLSRGHDPQRTHAFSAAATTARLARLLRTVVADVSPDSLGLATQLPSATPRDQSYAVPSPNR